MIPLQACRSLDFLCIYFSYICLLIKPFLFVLTNIYKYNLQEEIGKEIEDKKTELEPKVVETYEASPPEVKVIDYQLASVPFFSIYLFIYFILLGCFRLK